MSLWAPPRTLGSPFSVGNRGTTPPDTQTPQPRQLSPWNIEMLTSQHSWPLAAEPGWAQGFVPLAPSCQPLGGGQSALTRQIPSRNPTSQGPSVLSPVLWCLALLIYKTVARAGGPGGPSCPRLGWNGVSRPCPKTDTLLYPRKHSFSSLGIFCPSTLVM